MKFKVRVYKDEIGITNINDLTSGLHDTLTDTVFYGVVDTINSALSLWDELLNQYSGFPYCIRSCEEDSDSPERIIVAGVFDPSDRRERTQLVNYAAAFDIPRCPDCGIILDIEDSETEDYTFACENESSGESGDFTEILYGICPDCESRFRWQRSCKKVFGKVTDFVELDSSEVLERGYF